MNELLDKNFDVAKNWCTTGVGVMPNDVAMRDYLRDNDWTYPIVARSGTDVRDMKAEIEEVIEVEETETVAVIKEVTTIEMKGTIVTTEELHSKEKVMATEDMTTDLPKSK